MGSLSNYAENELLDHVLNAAYTAPTTIYLALCTANPTDAGTGASMNEAANANAYARTAITFGTVFRLVSQNAVVTFPQATGAWGTLTHWAVVDSATHGAGNMLAHGALSSSVAPVSGNTPSIATGQVTIGINSGFASDYLSHAWLDLMFRNQAFTKPSTYVALTTATVSDSNTGSTITEVANSNGYARVQVNINGGSSPTWTLASSGASDNVHAFTVGPASGGNWGTITSTVVVDSATHGAGNLLFYDNGTTDSVINDGDYASFAIGALDVSLS